jgi:hypothetical protein
VWDTVQFFINFIKYGKRLEMQYDECLG